VADAVAQGAVWQPERFSLGWRCSDAAQRGAAQLSVAQLGSDQDDATQAGAAQVGFVEDGAAQVGFVNLPLPSP
jgi:hypothetical protein